MGTGGVRRAGNDTLIGAARRGPLDGEAVRSGCSSAARRRTAIVAADGGATRSTAAPTRRASIRVHRRVEQSVATARARSVGKLALKASGASVDAQLDAPEGLARAALGYRPRPRRRARDRARSRIDPAPQAPAPPPAPWSWAARSLAREGRRSRGDSAEAGKTLRGPQAGVPSSRGHAHVGGRGRMSWTMRASLGGMSGRAREVRREAPKRSEVRLRPAGRLAGVALEGARSPLPRR